MQWSIFYFCLFCSYLNALFVCLSNRALKCVVLKFPGILFFSIFFSKCTYYNYIVARTCKYCIWLYVMWHSKIHAVNAIKYRRKLYQRQGRACELFLLGFFLITWTVNMCSLFDGWQNHASSDWLTAKREQDCQPWRRLFIQKKIYICCARFQLKKIWRMYNFFFRELEPIVVSKCMYIVYTFKHMLY